MVLISSTAGYSWWMKEEEESPRSLTSWKRQSDSKGKPDGDGKRRKMD